MHQYYIETQHLRNAGIELIFRIGVYIAIVLKNHVRSYFQQNTIVIGDKKLNFYITCENKYKKYVEVIKFIKAYLLKG